MKTTFTFAAIFSSVLLFNTAFAQEPLARNTSIDTIIPAQQRVAPGETYTNSFQAVVFPRLNGNVSVHVQKARHETIWVTIYNADGQRVLQDKLGNYSLVTREYTFTGHSRGTYTFELAGSGKVYTKEIILN